MEHLFLMFRDHIRRRSTVGMTPLDEWSARRRDLYLTTHDTHNRQISMPPVGFESTISAGERPVAARLLRSCIKQCLSLPLSLYFSPSSIRWMPNISLPSYLNSLNSRFIKIQSLWPLKRQEHEVNTVIWGKLTGFCCYTGFGIQSTGIVRRIAVFCSLVLWYTNHF